MLQPGVSSHLVSHHHHPESHDLITHNRSATIARPSVLLPCERSPNAWLSKEKGSRCVQTMHAWSLFLTNLIEYLNNKVEPLDRNLYVKLLRDHHHFLIGDNGILYFVYKTRKHKNFSKEWQLHIVVPERFIALALRICHTDRTIGLHCGVAQTLSSLYNYKLYWKTMNLDTVKYVSSCHRCQIDKDPKNVTPVPLQTPRPTFSIPFYSMQIDTYGPLITSNGFKYIIGVVCCFSGHLTLSPVANNTATEVILG